MASNIPVASSELSGVISHGGKLWYCCACLFGPMDTDLYVQCINCGHHFDGGCTYDCANSDTGLSIISAAHGGDPNDTYGARPIQVLSGTSERLSAIVLGLEGAGYLDNYEFHETAEENLVINPDRNSLEKRSIVNKLEEFV